MAKYLIRHACGHSVEFDLYGWEYEKIQKLKKQNCIKCWAEKAKDRKDIKGRYRNFKTDFQSFRSNS
jgi:hypothetical protein